MLEEQSPELFRLLEDLRRNLEILRETAEAPVNFNKREGGKKRRRWRRKKGGAGGGVEKNPTLEVQRQWLLQHARINYCMNICFYLMYKAEGRDVRSHPVIAHLVSIRKHIDRLEKTQIAGDDEPADLLEQISSDAQNDDDEEEEEEETGQDRYIDWTQDEKVSSICFVMYPKEKKKGRQGVREMSKNNAWRKKKKSQSEKDREACNERSKTCLVVVVVYLSCGDEARNLQSQVGNGIETCQMR